MARGSAYKPETPRRGTEKTTNDRNVQNIFAILNRIQDQANSLSESLTAIGATNVFSNLNITDNAIVRGDGDLRGVQDSGILIDDSDNVAGMGSLSCGAINVNDNPITNLGYIDFDLANAIGPAEGRLVWNADDGTLNLGMAGGNVNLQIGQEILLPNRPKNVEGSQINNGQAVRLSGATGAVPEVELINATEIHSDCTIALATENVADNQRGYYTTFGAVRDFDTSGLVEGAKVFLDTTDGLLTSTKPLFPNYTVNMGFCTRSHATEGVLFANIDHDRGSDLANMVNGTFRESFDARVTSDGATITMTIEQAGGGDLTMQFSDGMTLLDCTPTCSIELTAGTVSSPQENFIYIPKSTKVLTKSTTGFPSEEHIKVGYFFVQTAAYVQVDGPLINQNWNDHLCNTNLQGHVSHMAERIRRSGAVYFSGLAGEGTDDYTTSAAGDVTVQIGAGVGYQMHKQTIPAKDTSGTDDLHIINANAADGGAYLSTQNLYDITVDSTGATLTNKFFNIVLISVVNKSGEYSPVLVNIPDGSYNNLADAQADVDGYDVLTIPRQFTIESSVALLVARLTFRKLGGTWVYQSTVDLRGQRPTSASGGGTGGAITDFSDNQFTWFNNVDPTKIVTVDLSGITTGNTRTITMSDAAMTIPTTAQVGNYDLAYSHISADGSSHSFIDQDVTTSASPSFGTLTIGSGSITDSSGAISFGDENLTTTGVITGNSFITAQNIGIAADTDLMQLAANALTVNGTLQSSNVGIGVAPNSSYMQYILSPSSIAYNYYNVYSSIFKNAGSSDQGDSLTSGYFSVEHRDAGQTIGTIYGLRGFAYLSRGYVGTPTANRSIRGLFFNVQVDNYGSGTICYGDVQGAGVSTFINTGATITGDVQGHNVQVNAIGTVSGNVYMMYLDEIAGVDWGVYQNGTANNRFGGNVQIGSDTNGLVLGDSQYCSIVGDGTDMVFDSQLSGTGDFKFNNGYVYINAIRSGATQVAAGASAGEIWKTASHATLPDNVVMIGV